MTVKSECIHCGKHIDEHSNNITRQCPTKGYSTYEPKYVADVLHTEYKTLPLCPYCGTTYNPEEHDNYQVYQDIEDYHEVECSACDRPFYIETHVSYRFTTIQRDIEAEEAEKEAQREKEKAQRSAARAEVVKWLPGTRVRIKEDSRYAEWLQGRVGVVANEEPRDYSVSVILEPRGDRKEYKMGVFPDELERL